MSKLKQFILSSWNGTRLFQTNTVAELEAGFRANAESVRAADSWDETQKRMVTGTHPYLVAISRVKEGWSRDYIDKELGLRTSFGKISNPLQVIGGYEQPDKQ